MLQINVISVSDNDLYLLICDNVWNTTIKLSLKIIIGKIIFLVIMTYIVRRYIDQLEIW